ncbi:retrotransposon protein, putative, ty1-copia subclass [Tanacetum coccineum]
MWKGKRPSISHIKIWGCEVFVRREAQDKLEARFVKCLFVGYPEESFRYLFYELKDNVVFVAQRGVFLEREMISKEDSGSKIDLEEIQESVNKEPIVNTNTQQEVVTPVEPDDISLPIRRTKEKISDSTLTELNEPVNCKEAIASPEAAKWMSRPLSLTKKLTKDVFMAQPEGFENEKYPKRVCKLQKAIYGLKQDSYSWNLCFHEKVTQFGFSRSKDESCVYVKVSGSVVVFLVLYVDDILLIGNDIPTLQSVKDWLGNCFAMKDLGDATFILEWRILRMENSKKGNLPLHYGIQISKDLSPKTDDELGVDRHQQNPGEGHWTTVKNILRYLRNNKDRFLAYGREEELEVTGYCYASWQTYKDDSRSQSEKGHMVVKDIRSEDNPTDPFTKALAKSKHGEHAKSIGLKDKIEYENKEYLLDEQIPIINDDSTQEEIKAHQKHYDDANKVSCIMASSMSPELQKTFENTWAYEMNQQLKEMFQAKASKERLDVVKSLMACKPKPRASICAFVLEMKGYFDRLESLNMVFDAELSINIIVSGLLADYNQFVISYQMNRKETLIMELYSLLQIAEQGIKKIYVPSTSAALVLTAKSKIAPTSDPKEVMCFYRNTKGNWKRSCPKYPKDLKDGKGLKESRRLKHRELNLVMGNRKITLVTRIGKYKLMLKSGVRINLDNCCYSSEMTRNIISFHALYKDGYQFSFDNQNGDILVYSNGCFMFKASPCKGIYETVECISNNGNMILNVGSSNELDKSKLWHSRLGYVNKKCITQLQKDGVLESFDFKSDSDNVVFVARRGVFLDREMISKEDNGSKIDLKVIQESADEELIVNTDTQQEVVTPVEPDDISLPIRRTSSREEMASPEAAKWKEALKSEIQSMYDNQVWNLVDTTPGLNTVGCKWIFKKKIDMDGKVHTYKARLAAKGYTQTHDIDYEETFSPVAKIKSIRIMLAIVAFHDYEI